MPKLLVKSKPGTKCPKEGNPRQYIDDATAVAVPASAYYRRLIAEGSLVLVTETSPEGGN